MKKFFLALLLITAIYAVAICQKDSEQTKLINTKVIAIESALVILPMASVDSSKISFEPFREFYYKNRFLNELCKVEKIIYSPDVNYHITFPAGRL